MLTVRSVYRYIRILSIDVALGACAMSYSISYTLGAVVQPAWLFILGMTVWLIYTSDHLLDANKIKHPAHTERHVFHQRHFKSMMMILVLVLSCTCWLTIQYASNAIVFSGSGVLALSLLYLLLARKNGSKGMNIFPKEFFGAILYASGVVVIPWSSCYPIVGWEIIIFMGQVCMIALVNLLIFAWLDVDSDAKDNQTSFVRLRSKPVALKVMVIIFILFGLILLSSIIFISENVYFFKMQLVFGFMVLSLLGIYRKCWNTVDAEFYKGCADAVFFLPLLVCIS